IEVSPGSATGHILNIGSDAFYTATGFIEDGDGEPLAYVQGRMILEELDIAFFTNKQGRFYIQGVRPGTYRMEISQSGIPAISVTIPASKESLINLGKLSVLAK
ncbi:pilus assembly protein PapC, partial [Vibrio owensii]